MTWIVEVTSAAKIYTPSKHVVYAIQVMRSPTEEPYFVYRRFNDLYDLQIALLKMFPVEAGKAGVPRTIPFMPGKQILLPGQSKLQLAKSRIDAFNDYFYDLMEMDPKISQHEMVRKLLSRNKTDEAVEKELGIMYGTNGDVGGPAMDIARGPSTSEEVQRVAKIIGDAPTAEELRMFMSREAILSSTGAAVADAPAPAPAPAPVAPAAAKPPRPANPAPKAPKGKVLFAKDGDDDSSWAGAKLKSALPKRTVNQYAAFASPWSKTSQMKLDNVTFGELLLTIADDVEFNNRVDLVQNDLEETSTGSDIADYLVNNIEGMENADESIQIGQELLKLNVMRAVSCSDFQPRPGNFYFFMFRLDLLRSALGTANVMISRARRNELGRRGPTLDELQRHRENLMKCIRLVSSRVGGETDPLPPHQHQLRQFNNLNLSQDLLCAVCKKVLLPVSVACSICGDNVHPECERFVREFCLYPLELPSVLLDDATFSELEARGPRTDRVIQRRGPHPTPLVPGVVNTQALIKKQLAAESSGRSAGTASGDAENAAEVAAPKPMFSSVADARAPVVVRTLPMSFLTAEVDRIPTMTPAEWQGLLKSKGEEAEAAGQEVLAQALLRISKYGLQWERTTASKIPSIVPWNDLRTTCASAFGPGGAGPRPSVSTLPAARPTPPPAAARPAAAAAAAPAARPPATSTPAPRPSVTSVARPPVPTASVSRAPALAPVPKIDTAAARSGDENEDGDEEDGDEEEEDDDDGEGGYYDLEDDESTTSLALMLVNALGTGASVSKRQSMAVGAKTGSAASARRSSKMFKQASSTSMASRPLPTPTSLARRPSAATPIPPTPTTPSLSSSAAGAPRPSVSAPSPRPTPPTPTRPTATTPTKPSPTSATALPPRPTVGATSANGVAPPAAAASAAAATVSASSPPATGPPRPTATSVPARPPPTAPRSSSSSSSLLAPAAPSPTTAVAIPVPRASAAVPPTPSRAPGTTPPTPSAMPSTTNTTTTTSPAAAAAAAVPPVPAASRPSVTLPPRPTAVPAAPGVPRPSITSSAPLAMTPKPASAPTPASTPGPSPASASASAPAPASAPALPPTPPAGPRPSVSGTAPVTLPPRPTATAAPPASLPPRPTATPPASAAVPPAKPSRATGTPAPSPTVTAAPAAPAGPRPSTTPAPRPSAAAAAPRPGQRKLPASFAADRVALLSDTETPAATRDAWYNRLVDEAEDAGQLGLSAAVFVLRKKPLRGAAELAEWDLIMAKYAASID